MSAKITYQILVHRTLGEETFFAPHWRQDQGELVHGEMKGCERLWSAVRWTVTTTLGVASRPDRFLRLSATERGEIRLLLAVEALRVPEISRLDWYHPSETETMNISPEFQQAVKLYQTSTHQRLFVKDDNITFVFD